jgi:hypothetical protein
MAKQQMDLGLPVRVESKREQRIQALGSQEAESQDDKTKRMYQLLFFVGASGAGLLKPNPKPKPGDIVLYDPPWQMDCLFLLQGTMHWHI